jgi:protease-4
MPRLESTKRPLRRWIGSISFFAVIGLILGGLISIPAIHRPYIGTISISGPIIEQAYTDDILEMLRYATDNRNIKSVVLQIDSPGGEASLIEQIYLDVLRLRKEKPIVASIGARGASGGYYIAVASNFIYAQPSSQAGSIGAWTSLPTPEELKEDMITTGPFKSTGGSRRKAVADLETVKEEFVSAVMSQRGARLKLLPEELCRAEIYSGSESLKYGLIDDIGTSTAAIQKAAKVAGIRNYSVIDINKELGIYRPTLIFFSVKDLKSQTGVMPRYYYLCFELS